jgi:predicted RNase H-like HicB family nuclease
MKEKNEVKLKNNKIESIFVEVKFLKDKNSVLAYCPALQIITEGKNLDEAKAMFKEAYYLWIESVNAHADAVQTLNALGWGSTKATAKASLKAAHERLPVISINRAAINSSKPTWCY